MIIQNVVVAENQTNFIIGKNDPNLHRGTRKRTNKGGLNGEKGTDISQAEEKKATEDGLASFWTQSSLRNCENEHSEIEVHM